MRKASGFPARPTAFLFLRAGWKAEPSSRRGGGWLGHYRHGKAQPFRTAGGGASAARVGNWGPLYGVGYRNGYDNETTSISGGTFQMEFGGLWSYHPTTTCGSTQPCSSTTNAYTVPSFVNRAAYDGTNANSGGGDYRLLSSSPAINMFANTAQGCTQVLPYDLAGQVRDCTGHGSAGAYAQEMGNTPGFGW